MTLPNIWQRLTLEVDRNDPVDEALLRTARESRSSAELEHRVLRAFGEGYLRRAFFMAFEAHGPNWFTAPEATALSTGGRLAAKGEGGNHGDSEGCPMKPSMIKSVLLGVVSFGAYLALFTLGTVFLAIRDGTGSSGSDEISVLRPLQEPLVSGFAAFGVLAFISSRFERVNSSLLFYSFVGLVVVVNVVLIAFNAEFFIPQQRIAAFRTSLVSGVVTVAAAIFGAVQAVRRGSQ